MVISDHPGRCVNSSIYISYLTYDCSSQRSAHRTRSVCLSVSLSVGLAFTGRHWLWSDDPTILVHCVHRDRLHKHAGLEEARPATETKDRSIPYGRQPFQSNRGQTRNRKVSPSQGICSVGRMTLLPAPSLQPGTPWSSTSTSHTSSSYKTKQSHPMAIYPV